MVKLIIAVACFAFAGLVVNNLTHGRLFGALIPDPPAAISPSAGHSAELQAAPSTVRVLIGSQVWTCRMEHGSAKGCTLTYSPPARVHS
jgi:hypothetical protein